MYLVDRNKLRLDDPAGKYIPNLPQTWQKITIRQFMSHQSGIPKVVSHLPTFDQTLANFEGIPLSFTPGTKGEYNNFNFAVIGKIIERVSGQPYLDFMQQKIFLPLGMTRTGFTFIDANKSVGYILGRNRQLSPVNKVIPPGGDYNIPSGFLQSTLADLLTFDNAIHKNKLLSPNSYREIFTPTNPKLAGALGWEINYMDGKKIVLKEGSVKGYRSMFLFVPDRDCTVIFLSNFNSRNLHRDNIIDFIGGLLNSMCNGRISLR
jgi:CubicO group peptidase (beta-lactamase class C family)